MNGHNKRGRDDGAARDVGEADRTGTCGKRIDSDDGVWWCLRRPKHEGKCKGPHDHPDLDEPLDPVDESELGGEGGGG